MKRFLVLACVVLIGVAAPNSSFGILGGLKEPSLAMTPGHSQTKCLDVLRSKKQKFAGGYFFNWHSYLYYSGDTEQLDRFLDDLAKAGGRIYLHISKGANGSKLSVPGNSTEIGPTQWEVHHDPHRGEDRFDVTIYLGDGKIDIEKLHFPEMHDPNVHRETR